MTCAAVLTAWEFDHLNWLWPLVAAICVTLALGVYGVFQRRRALILFAGADTVHRLAQPISWGRAMLRLGLVGVALTAMAGALLGPRFGEVSQEVVRRGNDVIVLLDVSRSMLARDIAPNRLERAKLSLRDDLIPALGGDRVALITFAGVASLKCPLTSDYGFLRLVLDEVSTESSPRGGTLIGDALYKAADAFQESMDTNRVVILITDGEDHESDPIEAAKTLWTKFQAPVVAVALGDEREGARIPLSNGSGSNYLEYKGEVVWSKANFDDLRRIAEVSGFGAFIPVGTRNFDLGRIYRERIVPALEHKTVAQTERVQRPSQYHAFAVPALAALLIESLWPHGRRAPRPAARSRQTVAA